MEISLLPLVIVPLDGSPLAERALAPAAAIAARAETTMLLVSARFGPDDGTRLDYLRGIAATMPVPCDIELVEDRLAHTAILDAARATPGALVVMATHGRGGIGQALLGSVTEEVVRNHDQPVVLVGPQLGSSWALDHGPVLVCTDGSVHAATITAPIAILATQIDLNDVTVVQVNPPGATAGDTALVADALAANGLTVTTRVIEDRDPAVAITTLAGALPATFIAMATHGRTGLDRVTIGSVTAAIIRRSPCPVFVARPRALRR